VATARFHPGYNAPIAFEILGPLTVRSGDAALELGGARPRAVLAMLLMHPNTPVSAERLAVAVLGGDASTRSIKTIRVHVSRLRKALGSAEALTTHGGGLPAPCAPGRVGRRPLRAARRRGAHGRASACRGAVA
jgi:hypothetical protein